MPFIYRNLALSCEDSEETLPDRLTLLCDILPGDMTSWQILRKGVDARRKSSIKFVYTLAFTVSNEEEFWQKRQMIPGLERLAEELEEKFPRIASKKRIVIVGMGPAGLFAARRLLEYGIPSCLIERGRRIDERARDVQLFWQKGTLDPESNVQFGEGGAGTFSDGKLTTRVRDRRIGYVLDTLIECGAPREIRYLAKPHLGTDRLREVITRLRDTLIAGGVDVRFSARMSDLLATAGTVSGLVVNDQDEIPCDHLILAPGHSARDTYDLLRRKGLLLEAKPFAVGVRVEHPQELMNRLQYGMPRHQKLPPAEYAVTYNDPESGRGVYSFCMCPGGVVIGASTEPGGIVTNGMSLHSRSAPYANSALVVSVRPEDFPSTGPLSGIAFQRKLEESAFLAGGGAYLAPAENMISFLDAKAGMPVRSSYRPGICPVKLQEIFPDFITEHLKKGIRAFDRQMKGFVTAEATLTGVETRTSSPLRICRGDDCQSVSLRGLYPAGEGAGYAGGIMSAALDGIRVADVIAAELQS